MAEFDSALKQSLALAASKALNMEVTEEDIQLSIPKRREQGDYSTNLAMKLAKKAGMNPRQSAQAILDAFDGENTEKAEIAGPGFLNFFMKKSGYSAIVEEILKRQSDYGQGKDNQIKVNLEYVSANPTGDLHIGHARGAAWGDSIARIMKKAGYDVTREYYVNDAGNQIRNLALSLWARYAQAQGVDAKIGPDGYNGPDVKEKGEELARLYPGTYLEPNEESLDFFRKEGIEFELAKIRRDLKNFGVEFDVWTSEQALRDAGKVDEVLGRLSDMGYTYEQDGALWFASSRLGDDKDRVLRKQDGSLTYLVPDIANHIHKYERGFDVIVDFFGADHHGYIPRLKASMEASGNNPESLHVDIIQMVRMMKDGKEFKMSKREGNAMTLNDLVDMTGADAARYFFASRALDSHMDFDLDLAVSQSSDNPVYYAQYAHARICSILRKSDFQPADVFDQLTDEKEIDLMKALAQYPKVIQDAARTRQVHKLTHYIQNLAVKFHSFYTACKVNDPDNPELSAQRMGLLKSVQIVLADALNLVGVHAPESM